MTIFNENGSVNYKKISKMSKEEIIENLSTLNFEQLKDLYEKEKIQRENRVFATKYGSTFSLIGAGIEVYGVSDHIKNNLGTKDLIEMILAGLCVCALLCITANQASELVISSKFVKIAREYLLTTYPELFKDEDKKKHLK